MTRTLATIGICLFCFSLAISSIAQTDLAIEVQDNSLRIETGSSPLLVYKFDNVPFKPYVQRLYTPGGNNILRDAPEDHLHHHGLMFAIGLNDVSFWAETDVDGMQIHQAFHDVQISDDSGAMFRETLLWSDPDGSALAHELRTIHVQHSNEHNANVLTWQTSLAASSTSVEATGAHYYGLGMRFLESMDEVGVFLNSVDDEGAIFRGEERLADADWCAYSVTGDFPVTVCMMNDPQNDKPATWFTMPSPFAYLSATLRYHESPLEITQHEPLKLRYGVALWDGIVSKAQIESLYQDWLRRDQASNRGRQDNVKRKRQ